MDWSCKKNARVQDSKADNKISNTENKNGSSVNQKPVYGLNLNPV